MVDEKSGLIVFKHLPIEKVERVLERVDALMGEWTLRGWRLTMCMDLEAANATVGLDIDRLLDFPDADFLHDVLGIAQHTDRRTGDLGDGFLPRCAARKEAVR